MMKQYLLLIAAVVFLSCKSPTEPFTKLIEGTYNYFAYDSNDQLIVTGTLIISQIDSTQIQGSWQLVAVNNAQKTGPQNGSGSLSGVLKKGAVSINLNPNFVDNNVVLQGTMSSAGFNGKWEWIGFAGVLNSGSFNAVRKGI